MLMPPPSRQVRQRQEQVQRSQGYAMGVDCERKVARYILHVTVINIQQPTSCRNTSTTTRLSPNTTRLSAGFLPLAQPFQHQHRPTSCCRKCQVVHPLSQCEPFECQHKPASMSTTHLNVRMPAASMPTPVMPCPTTDTSRFDAFRARADRLNTNTSCLQPASATSHRPRVSKRQHYDSTVWTSLTATPAEPHPINVS